MAELAAGQHGLVRLDQLLALGFARSTVSKAVAEGRLHRVGRGVYAVGHSSLTMRGRWLAAVWSCGPGAVLSHRSAAALHGMRRTARAKIDVTVPRRSGRRPAAHIDLHRTRRLSERDVTIVDGIPVTTAARTLTDLADVLTPPALRRALDEAEYLRLDGTPRPIDGRRGTPKLITALQEHRADNPTRSGLEAAFLDLMARAGLPRPRVNAYVPTDLRLVEVDFWWPAQRLVVQTDGGRAHTTSRARTSDPETDAALARAGLTTLRFAEDEIHPDAHPVTEAVRAGLYQTAPAWEESPTHARIRPP